ncbi:hypothetical protein [Paraburkholderia fungorum]|uniref:hypothetical protein n=1 Tax=Paraburkholderia fungorum TaxID=134537 RepID=UPI001C1EC99D|nr:hypothetical protein [Paraburkholderia fungorum]MBU7436481.1 hypothetical protein [Paraburkholderia fungorum]
MERYTDDGKPFYVQCDGCFIEVAYAATREQSDAIWNRRAASEVQADHIADERKLVAKSVFGGINALRWLLNITTEFDRKDVRTRQAARLLDEFCSGNGVSNRVHLEHLWKTLNDALSLEDTLECLAASSTGDQEVGS